MFNNPESFVDPITEKPMKNPVIASDGGSYENHQIDFDLGESAFSRKKTVSVFQGQCDKCGLGQQIIISSDTSDGEYGDVCICIPCINDMVEHFNDTRK